MRGHAWELPSLSNYIQGLLFLQARQKAQVRIGPSSWAMATTSPSSSQAEKEQTQLENSIRPARSQCSPEIIERNKNSNLSHLNAFPTCLHQGAGGRRWCATIFKHLKFSVEVLVTKIRQLGLEIWCYKDVGYRLKSSFWSTITPRRTQYWKRWKMLIDLTNPHRELSKSQTPKLGGSSYLELCYWSQSSHRKLPECALRCGLGCLMYASWNTIAFISSQVFSQSFAIGRASYRIRLICEARIGI